MSGAGTLQRRALISRRWPAVQAWWRSLSKLQRSPFVAAAVDAGADPEVVPVFFAWLDRVHAALGRPEPQAEGELVAAELREARRALRLSRRRLAELVGTRAETLGAIERGEEPVPSWLRETLRVG